MGYLCDVLVDEMIPLLSCLAHFPAPAKNRPVRVTGGDGSVAKKKGRDGYGQLWEGREMAVFRAPCAAA